MVTPPVEPPQGHGANGWNLHRWCLGMVGGRKAVVMVGTGGDWGYINGWECLYDGRMAWYQHGITFPLVNFRLTNGIHLLWIVVRPSYNKGRTGSTCKYWLIMV